MPVRLRHNPLKLPAQILNLQAAGKVATLPAWYAAMQLNPPAAKPLQSVVPSEVGQFQLPNGRSLIWNTQMAAAVRSTRRRAKTLSVHQKEVASTAAAVLAVKGRSPAVIDNDAVQAANLAYSVPEIVYAEDEIRRVFYKRHPFELDRARCIVEREKGPRVEWTDIHGGSAFVSLSGESVVQRTLFLMEKAERITVNEERSKKIVIDRKNQRSVAYKQALSEFYAAREEEERRELKAYAAAELAAEKAAAVSADGISTPPVSGLGLSTTADTLILTARRRSGAFWREEESDLADSRLFNQTRLEMVESKRQLKEKLAAFDQQKSAQSP
ncbi:hypothetical protein BASA50_000192 [Batrachochytrium salamandrivorans]|uniref:Small ribosomal subunit protein mS23 n=1 Tax=Batrachochytrium salamandrivorans TaxID=1357716 RepID=A0ABQ8EXJ0_9FUNG|nr:hypothetical protein BASA60_002903 [Batrachochytrium salamandrivorans]KAH6586828.1 hypothetical protein BASA50_000192 [Batrachochytrium salamandrivorans]